MKVWVVMGNDYPAAVCASAQAAEIFIDGKKSEDEERKRSEGGGPRIYWRSYEFDLRE